MASITFEKEGYTLIYTPNNTKDSADWYDVEFRKPSGERLVSGIDKIEDVAAVAEKTMDNWLTNHKAFLVNIARRDATPWQKLKKGYEVRIWKGIIDSPNYFNYTVRKDGKDLIWGNSHKGEKVAMNNARAWIKRNHKD
jgi:hypothetical protein